MQDLLSMKQYFLSSVAVNAYDFYKNFYFLAFSATLVVILRSDFRDFFGNLLLISARANVNEFLYSKRK